MLAVLLALALAVVVPGGTSPVPTPPGPALFADFAAPGDYFEIDNSGSTNTSGYRAAVRRDGAARFVSFPARDGQIGTRTVDPAAARRVLADLAALTPFPAARAVCMRSASFGSVTVVVWKGEPSPPLGCGNEPAYAALTRDVAAVLAQLKIPLARTVRPIGPLPQASP